MVFGPNFEPKSLKSDLFFLEKALEQAHQAQKLGDVPVGAVVVRKNEIIGIGYNQRENLTSPIAHAEVLALGDAAKTLRNWRLEECTLYITLEPCLMCLGACVLSRVNRVVYGAKDPKGGAQSLGYPFHQDERLNHRFHLDFVDFPAGGELLTEFFRVRRAQKNNGI